MIRFCSVTLEQVPVIEIPKLMFWIVLLKIKQLLAELNIIPALLVAPVIMKPWMVE